jgi:hypothetical protein
MSMTRRTRTLAIAVAATVGALGAGSSAHAAAPAFSVALSITSPADQSYINNTREAIGFSGATPGDTVTLSVMDMTTTTTSTLGSTMAGPSGAGTITPAANLVLPTARDSLMLYETDGLGDPVQQTGLVTTLYVNTVPSFSGILPGGAVDSEGTSFIVGDAIPNQPVLFNVYVGDAITQSVNHAQTLPADSTGMTAAYNTGQLGAGEYTVTAATEDSEGNWSTPARQLFYVAPREPTITSPWNGMTLVNNKPTVTVNNVIGGAAVDIWTLETDAAGVGFALKVGGAVNQGQTGQIKVRLTTGLPTGRSIALWASQAVSENGTQVSSDGDATPGARTSSAEMNNAISVDVDASAPTLTGDNVSNGGVTHSARPSFTAAGGPINYTRSRSGVEVYLDGRHVGYAQTDGVGNAYWQPRLPVADGTHTLYVVPVDDGGSVNATLRSNTITFRVHTGNASAVTLTHRALRSGLAASPSGWTKIALLCPATATGCDASGTLAVALPAASATRVPALRSHVIARFRAVRIAIGHTKVISVRLTAAMLHSLQARHIRRIRVMASTVNHYGHIAVTRVQYVWLRMPAQRRTTQAVCPHPSDGGDDADDTYPACLNPSTRTEVLSGHPAGLGQWARRGF